MIVADVVQDVAVTNFIASSKSLKEALKSANLLKSLQLNTLISGQIGTGRHTLASMILSDTPVIHADDPMLDIHLENHTQLIIDNIEKLNNASRFLHTIQKSNIKVVVIADESFDIASLDSLFSVHIVLPPLEERSEDILPLVDKFKKDAAVIFGEVSKKDECGIDIASIDLKYNAFSLKRAVFLHCFALQIQKEELLFLNESYLSNHLGKIGNVYRDNLYVYEVPLIKSGFKLYKSQLKIAENFGLNRNTLRKKINEWKEYL